MPTPINFEDFMSGAVGQACDTGEGLDDLLLMTVRGMDDADLREQLEEYLAEIRPTGYWPRRPGHEKRRAAAVLAYTVAEHLLRRYHREERLKPAESLIPRFRLCLELALEQYWRIEVIERWGPVLGFRLHPYVDTFNNVRVAFFAGESKDVAFDLPSECSIEDVQASIRSIRASPVNN